MYTILIEGSKLNQKIINYSLPIHFMKLKNPGSHLMQTGMYIHLQD